MGWLNVPPGDSNVQTSLRTTALELIIFLTGVTLGLPYYVTGVLNQESVVDTKGHDKNLLVGIPVPGDSESVGLRYLGKSSQVILRPSLLRATVLSIKFKNFRNILGCT